MAAWRFALWLRTVHHRFTSLWQYLIFKTSAVFLRGLFPCLHCASYPRIGISFPQRYPCISCCRELDGQWYFPFPNKASALASILLFVLFCVALDVLKLALWSRLASEVLQLEVCATWPGSVLLLYWVLGFVMLLPTNDCSPWSRTYHCLFSQIQCVL